MALQLDPWIDIHPDGYGGNQIRLSALVHNIGWEEAKRRYPEVRRVLQQSGQAVRKYDPDFWVRVTTEAVDACAGWDLPVVVTDCRYPNEAQALRERGFLLVRIERRGAEDELSEDARTHESENALNDYDPDVSVTNSGSIDQLYAAIDSLVRSR
ncbi:deoxynucleotide monophosphate kinase family protein [Allostreptomyces psammosilenae]|uniref:Phosphomevalonate kinase n=1 Tax=Allostreptomyces psammosilenae TaxID=1892865 RepID=A0A853A6B2_9ACTN|nr:hypothetical protein [Allostreptomyces psammosilenae]NYI06078.1 hypothetical protein [Allostreptomyces psammosilenae]